MLGGLSKNLLSKEEVSFVSISVMVEATQPSALAKIK